MPASEHRLSLSVRLCIKLPEISVISCSSLLNRHMHRNVQALIDMIQGPNLIIHSEAIIRDWQVICRLLPEFLNGANHVIAPITYTASKKLRGPFDFRAMIG